MTKLVIVLAVAVAVILVIVFVAVRNMRAEDPEEFADQPRGRGGNRGSRDERFDRREPAGRQPARAGQAGRPAGRQAANGYRPAARDLDERRDHRGDGYDQSMRNGHGYDGDRGAGPRRGQDGRRSAAPSRGPEERRGGKGRPGESQAPARPARSRRSADSSEWDSSEWEKLSDVDYWAELASDKPLTTTAQPAAQARPERPRAGREAGTAAVRGPVPGGAAPGGAVGRGTVPEGVPRRDPVTGLPVRGRPRPADAEPAGAAAVQADFAAPPVPASPAPGQVRPAAARADLAAAPVPASPAPGQVRPLAEPRPPVPKHAGPPGFPGPVRGAPPNRAPVDPDDDPLTSPSFPRIPASDSRSYHSGRSSTPAQGSRPPARHTAPTQQFTSYGSPAPQRASGQRASGQHAVPADVGGDTDRTNPDAYLPDPLLNGDPYPARTASGPATPPPPPPVAPTSGNPYGSYVTSDSPAPAFSYDDYPVMPGNGHQSYLPSAVPADAEPAGNGYWPHRQPTAPGDVPGPGASGYLDGPAQNPGPRHASAQAADYGNGHNGYGQHAQAGYLPGGYPAGSRDQAGYARQDSYGPDGYGGYPEYGAAGH